MTAVSETLQGRLEVHNPATGELCGTVPVASSADVVAAVDAAREAQGAWHALGLSERQRVLRRFLTLLLERESEILDVLQQETGKPRREALVAPLTVARICQYYLTRSKRFLADRRGGSAVPGLTRGRVILKPYGVVGFITPWNYPFVLPIGDTIPALLAGNSVVVKPSELTPMSALKGAELLHEAGVPESVFSVVAGAAAPGAELVRQVDYISFTGSTPIGRKIAVAAGERLIPYSLELGGKNPLVVLEGAPLEQAVDGFLAGAFFNAGQTCIAVERAFIEEPVYERFVALAVERARALELGWSMDWDIEMGCLIDRTHTDRVMGHIEDARARGAEVLCGGVRRPDLGPTFVEPTLLAGVEPDAELYEEETFGPVVALYPVRDEAEAIERANETPYGLNASVWGRTGGQAVRIARRLDTGSAAVNASLMIYHCLGVPMGGVKQSGIGRRHGEAGIKRFTQSQSIVSSPRLGGGYDSILTWVSSKSSAKALSRAFHWRRWFPGFR